MAKILVQSKSKIVVMLMEMELMRYGNLQMDIHGKLPQRVYCNAGLPFMTWQGHDGRVVNDIIDAIKKMGNYAAKIKGTKIGWGLTPWAATVRTERKIRFPVFAKHSEPYVQAERGDDGYVTWTMHGHYFNDDLPSMVAYVAALEKLKTEVKANRL